MRAGPLSNDNVVKLLNRFFVPVYVSNEDYRATGPAPREERIEYQRIYREALQAGLSTGTVHAYVLTSDGHPVDSLHVAQAARVELLTAMLECSVTRLQPKEGDPAVRPRGQTVAPSRPAGAVVLHVTSRYLRQQGSELVPLGEEAGLGLTRNAGWSAYAAEGWVVFTRDECARLLPSGRVRVGLSWELDRELSARLLNHFYPATENNDLAKNRLEDHSLLATVLSITQGVARVRLDGRLRMKHPFYHRDDDNEVQATLAGYADWDQESKQFRVLRIATLRATYGSGAQQREFGVIVDAR